MSGRIPGVLICHLPGDADQRSLFEHFKRTWGVRAVAIKFISQTDGDVAVLVDLENEAAAEKVRRGFQHKQQQQLLLLCCFCCKAWKQLRLAVRLFVIVICGAICRCSKLVLTLASSFKVLWHRCACVKLHNKQPIVR